MNESVTLHYRQGTSDKVYSASIVPEGIGFSVRFAYGRRGSTLQTGTKTQQPVVLAEAKEIFDKLVREKTAKGYTPGEDGTPYQNTPKEDSSTGIACQLLNAVDEKEAHALIHDDAHWMQEKKDGRRCLVEKTMHGVRGINRKGLAIALPTTIQKAAEAVKDHFLVDGEAVGDRLFVFDLLRLGADDLRGLPYQERHCRLKLLRFKKAIEILPTAKTTEEKTNLYHIMAEMNREGVVFKDVNAPYTGGRPASGGPQLKHKFTASASVIVSRVNGKRSVGLKLWGGLEVGNVTIPANHSIPKEGAVVEVRYLYAFQESGKLYQPVYLGVRDDVDATDCVKTQLKYRAAVEEDEP